MLLLWLAGASAVALFAGITWHLAPLEPNVVVLQLAFTPRAFGQVIHSWPAEHLARYRAHFPAEFALLLSYGAFGYLLANRTRILAGGPAAFRVWGTWALPLAAAFDAAEGAFQLWLTEVPRFGADWAYMVSASFSSLKLLVLFGYALWLVCALLAGEG
jgi:hypothetical protein